MKNQELRKLLKERKVYFWEIADMLKVSESTITRMMRYELNEENQKRFEEALRQIEEERKQDVK